VKHQYIYFYLFLTPFYKNWKLVFKIGISDHIGQRKPRIKEDFTTELFTIAEKEIYAAKELETQFKRKYKKRYQSKRYKFGSGKTEIYEFPLRIAFLVWLNIFSIWLLQNVVFWLFAIIVFPTLFVFGMFKLYG